MILEIGVVVRGSLHKEDASVHLGNLVEIGKLNLLAFYPICFQEFKDLSKSILLRQLRAAKRDRTRSFVLARRLCPRDREARPMLRPKTTRQSISQFGSG